MKQLANNIFYYFTAKRWHSILWLTDLLCVNLCAMLQTSHVGLHRYAIKNVHFCISYNFVNQSSIFLLLESLWNFQQNSCNNFHITLNVLPSEHASGAWALLALTYFLWPPAHRSVPALRPSAHVPAAFFIAAHRSAQLTVTVYKSIDNHAVVTLNCYNLFTCFFRISALLDTALIGHRGYGLRLRLNFFCFALIYYFRHY